MEAGSGRPEVTLTWFQPDERKAGGAYLTRTGTVEKYDSLERVIVLRGGTRVPLDELTDIASPLFHGLDDGV